MLTILLTLLVIAVVAYVVYLVINMLPLPAPVKTIAYLILGLVLLLWVLSVFGFGIPSLR